MKKLILYFLIIFFSFTSSINACYYVGNNTEAGLGAYQVNKSINKSIGKDVDGITIDFGDTLPKETLLNLELKSGQKLHVTNHLTERMIERNVSFDDISYAIKMYYILPRKRLMNLEENHIILWEKIKL